VFGANGADNVSHLLKWESSYPPEEGVEHSVMLTEEISQIPDGGSSGETSSYVASWDIYLGSMTEPTTMSSSQVEQYGIEKVDTSDPSEPTPAGAADADGPVYRAKSPEVRIEFNSASTANQKSTDTNGKSNNKGKSKGNNK
jgi:hypothetical protein